MTFFLKILRFFILLKKFKNTSAALFLSRFPGNHKFEKGCTMKWKNNGLYFPDKDVFLSKSEIQVFNGYLHNICRVVKRYRLYRDNNFGLCIVATKFGQEVTIIVDENSILFAADEIFGEELYDFEADGNYVVLDVGMNRGIAALFFSCFPRIKHIYGYEPFEATRKLAINNLAINPGLKDKITIKPYGWSNKNAVISVPFTGAGYLGATTTSFFIERNKQASKEKDAVLAEVDLRSASDEIELIMSSHPGERIFLKLDCEGAEYEIMEQLENTGMLNKISLIIAEWHFIDKRKIIDRLRDNDFILVAPNRADDTEMGMIYAFNKNVFKKS